MCAGAGGRTRRSLPVGLAAGAAAVASRSRRKKSSASRPRHRRPAAEAREGRPFVGAWGRAPFVGAWGRAMPQHRGIGLPGVRRAGARPRRAPPGRAVLTCRRARGVAWAVSCAKEGEVWTGQLHGTEAAGTGQCGQMQCVVVRGATGSPLHKAHGFEGRANPLGGLQGSGGRRPCGRSGRRPAGGRAQGGLRGFAQGAGRMTPRWSYHMPGSASESNSTHWRPLHEGRGPGTISPMGLMAPGRPQQWPPCCGPRGKAPPPKRIGSVY